MFKKVLALMLVGLMAIGLLAGCASNEAPAEGEDEALVVEGPDDLANARIGCQEGTTGDLYATENYPEAKMSRFKKAVDAAMDLQNGRLDAVVLDAVPAQKIVDTMDDLMILDAELTSEEYAIAVRKEDTELLENINNALAAIKESDNIDIYDDYFIAGNKEAELPQREDTAFEEDLIMGTNAEFEPFEYREDGKIVGYDVELATDIAKALGKNLKIEDMNFDSLITALNAGKVDMVVAGMTADPERKESVNFSDPYFTATQVIIVKKPE